MSGDLFVPYFDKRIGVTLKLDGRGGLATVVGLPHGTVEPGIPEDTTAPSQTPGHLMHLELKNLFALDVDQIGFEALPGQPTALEISGRGRLAVHGLVAPSLSVERLRVSSDGAVSMAGGGIDVAGGLELEFHGFGIKLTRLNFGVRKDTGERWISFESRARVTNRSPIAVSAKELRILWRPEDVGRDPLRHPPRIEIDGIALSIEAGPVTGGGALFLDATNEQYAGALQLVISGIGVNAIGILTTRLPDGKRGVAILIIISGEFLPIHLGFGFTLNGVGGLLGVNRTVMVDVLRSGIKNNTLDSIMFPVDPVRNAPAIVSNLQAVFPPLQDRYVFGPMAIIGWGTPPILTLKIALILEVPEPVRLVILGRLSALLPDEKNAVVRLQMDAIGVIDFNKGDLSLDATLFDSRLLTFALTGDMALRANWGDSPNFVLAIGGFNPRFPTPAGFPRLERVAISLAAGDNPRLRLEAYLALTSNTVQFGARLDLYAKAGPFSVEGFLSFDALFQFSPFQFAVDIGAGVALRWNKQVLMSIYLEVTLSGPSPWHVRGTATFQLFFVKASIPIDFRIGPAEPPPLPKPVDVTALLREALGDARNWSGELPSGEHPLVTLHEVPGASGVLVHPLAVLTVRQRVVPLNRHISRFGNTAPGGTAASRSHSGLMAAARSPERRSSSRMPSRVLSSRL